MDVSSLCGVLCAIVGKHSGNQRLLAEGRRLIAWVVDKQLNNGAWFYTHPPRDSHIKHDNYHTGEIVDSLLEYELTTGDTCFHEAWRKGLEFYRLNLFTPAWRPRWMSDKEFPYDVHGYSQGIITFSMAGELGIASSVAEAALKDIFNHREGRFYYQKRRRRIVRVTLMRWCQAWMSFALSHLVLALHHRHTQ
ncbi:MAG: hypothetical protein HN348_21150 [Proteobacteria bacterium]|jgi:hypothetical protein|nr:hypothetical protein [Pseudomonadota bacterium]